jgi:hypothetical protein
LATTGAETVCCVVTVFAGCGVVLSTGGGAGGGG